MLVITLQPDEGFQLFFNVKAPEDQFRLETRPFHFSYREAFGELPGAYETLIFDVLTGDQTLFVRGDEVEESWRLFTPLLDAGRDLHPYEAGTWGPEAADELLFGMATPGPFTESSPVTSADRGERASGSGRPIHSGDMQMRRLLLVVAAALALLGRGMFGRGLRCVDVDHGRSHIADETSR